MSERLNQIELMLGRIEMLSADLDAHLTLDELRLTRSQLLFMVFRTDRIITRREKEGEISDTDTTTT